MLSSGLLQVLRAEHTQIFSLISQKTIRQQIFTPEKPEPLFIFTLLLRTAKMFNEFNSLCHRKTSTVWFWQWCRHLLWQTEQKAATLRSCKKTRRSHRITLYDHNASRRTETCRRCSRTVTVQCTGSRNRAFCEDFRTTSGAFVIHRQKNEKKKEFECIDGVSSRLLPVEPSALTKHSEWDMLFLWRRGAKNEKCFCSCFTISVITPHRTHTRTQCRFHYHTATVHTSCQDPLWRSATQGRSQ